MTSTTSFRILGRPRAKARPRASVVVPPGSIDREYRERGSGGVLNLVRRCVKAFTDGDTLAEEQRVRGNARPYAPDEPHTEAVFLRVHFRFRLPKGRKDLEAGDPYTPTPDLDNLEKLVMDALNQVFYEDDRLVCGKLTTKTYDERDEIEIAVEPFRRKSRCEARETAEERA